MASVISSDTAGTYGAQAKPDAAQPDSEFMAALSWLLPNPIAKRGGRIERLQEPLLDAEATFIRDAVPRRVMEFTAGRACARAALNQLGRHDVPVCMGKRRQPLWPEGITGSISHAGGYCVGAACTRDQLAGLGVDVESAAPLSDALIDFVCTPAEKAWCENQAEHITGLLAKFVFSAKESVFKCLYPVFGIELEFDEVGVDLDMNNGRFTARVSRMALEVDADIELHGRLACTSRLVMTAAMLQDDDLAMLSSWNVVRELKGCEGRYVCE